MRVHAQKHKSRLNRAIGIKAEQAVLVGIGLRQPRAQRVKIGDQMIKFLLGKSPCRLVMARMM